MFGKKIAAKFKKCIKFLPVIKDRILHELHEFNEFFSK